MYSYLKCSLSFHKVCIFILGRRKVSLQQHDVSELVTIFNSLFNESESTELVTGAKEPLYLPSSKPDGLHQVISTLDYFSSALHEISHWCIAGESRRKLVDFGYWYEPDGRTASQQRDFEKVEIKPQALEWLFAQACSIKFRLSVDNVSQSSVGASEEFQVSVVEQVHHYMEQGLPRRAALFLNALQQKFQVNGQKLEKTAFSLSQLA